VSASPPPSQPELLEIAVNAACRGGLEVRQRIGRVTGQTSKSSTTDPVTDADKYSDTAIRAVLKQHRPDDGLLTEESEPRTGSTGMRWVVDALDGTVNYTYGIPHFCVSIACERWTEVGWSVLVGAVHDIVRDETFTAALGLGAHLNGGRIRVNDPESLEQSLVAVEFSYLAESRGRQAAAAERLLHRVRDIRSTGSSALDLCWTACGRLDGFAEDELSRWDWTAGALIVAEAGGMVTPFGSGIVASATRLHDGLLAAVQPSHDDAVIPDR
jgi:myo-inositol-1(or 4)-monophosphatase